MAHGWWKISSARAALKWPRKTARSLALEDAFAGRCRATPGALKDFSGQIRALGNTGGSRCLFERSPAPCYFWNLGQRGAQPPAQAGKSFSFSSPPPAEGRARPFAGLRAAVCCFLRELEKSCAGRVPPAETAAHETERERPRHGQTHTQTHMHTITHTHRHTHALSHTQTQTRTHTHSDLHNLTQHVGERCSPHWAFQLFSSSRGEGEKRQKSLF